MYRPALYTAKTRKKKFFLLLFFRYYNQWQKLIFLCSALALTSIILYELRQKRPLCRKEICFRLRLNEWPVIQYSDLPSTTSCSFEEGPTYCKINSSPACTANIELWYSNSF
jgi:hypothetical protein